MKHTTTYKNVPKVSLLMYKTLNVLNNLLLLFNQSMVSCNLLNNYSTTTTTKNRYLRVGRENKTIPIWYTSVYISCTYKQQRTKSQAKLNATDYMIYETTEMSARQRIFAREKTQKKVKNVEGNKNKIQKKKMGKTYFGKLKANNDERTSR